MGQHNAHFVIVSVVHDAGTGVIKRPKAVFDVLLPKHVRTVLVKKKHWDVMGNRKHVLLVLHCLKTGIAFVSSFNRD